MDKRKQQALYKLPKPLCIVLEKNYKRILRQYYRKKAIDNKKFWETFKPFLPVKIMARNKIKLVDKNFLITNEEKIPDTFDTFLNVTAVNLKIPEYQICVMMLKTVNCKISSLLKTSA